jgi:hypothetical protein
MDDKFIYEKMYEAFVEAIRRYRWFVLGNVFLCCLALGTVYEEHGFAESQLHRVVQRKILAGRSRMAQKWQSLQAPLAALGPEQLGDYEHPKDALDERTQRLLDDAVETKITMDRGSWHAAHLELPRAP